MIARLARASSAVRTRTASSRVSWVRRRSVMSRTRASTSFWPSERKTATRASVGKVVPSRRRSAPSSVTGTPGTMFFQRSAVFSTSGSMSRVDIVSSSGRA